MSLFDGIGTAKVVIDNLNLDIEVYYSVEIEEDAIQVVDLNHGDSVIHLGDIRSLTEEKVCEAYALPLIWFAAEWETHQPIRDKTVLG